MKRVLLLCFILGGFFSQAQLFDPSVNIGLVYTEPDLVSPGFTAVAPLNGSTAYLLDNCGKIVNQWGFSSGFNEACTYITPEGNCAMLISNGGGGGAVYGNSCFEVKDWDDELVWSYCPQGEYVGLHNDLVPLPNGNYLGVVQRTYPIAEALQNGFDPANIGTANNYLSESIVEFMPIGTNDAEIVWEWDTWDHMVQEYDSTKLNYGIVSEHPEKYHFNMDISSPATGALFTHINSVEYDEENDFILVSMFSIHEFFIIDHSTTLEESAGSTGGNFGKGGDILYRWGNPQNYGRGGPGDRQLFGQHDARWIPSGYVNEGKISIYNNDGGDESEIVIVEPVRDADGQFVFDTGNDQAYLPEAPFWTWRDNVWTYPPPSTLFMSGVAPLQNGNMLMCDASDGLLAEVTQDDEVVWVYQIPGGNTNQGSGSDGSAFKVRKYLPDYEAFVGRDMTGSGFLESDNIVSDNCTGISQVEGENNAVIFSVDIGNSGGGCAIDLSPIMTIFNGGSNPITEMEISYSINGGFVTNESWSGNVDPQMSESIPLPVGMFNSMPTNQFNIEITSVNATYDDAPDNNVLTYEWDSVDSEEIGTYLFEVQSDNWGYEIFMNIYDENGDVAYATGNFDNNTFFSENFDLDLTGCYEVEAIDQYGDGITDGGFMRVTGPNAVVLYQTPSSDYSTEIDYFLATDSVIPPPVSAFTAVIEEPGLTTLVNFTQSATDATTYSWVFGDGATSDEENPMHEYLESGVYEVCLEVTNDAGTDTFCQDIEITVLVGLAEELSLNIDLYPNPANDVLFVTGLESTNYNFQITDLAGKLIADKNQSGTDLIDVELLNSGVYFLTITDEAGRSESLRFIIK